MRPSPPLLTLVCVLVVACVARRAPESSVDELTSTPEPIAEQEPVDEQAKSEPVSPAPPEYVFPEPPRTSWKVARFRKKVASGWRALVTGETLVVAQEDRVTLRGYQVASGSLLWKRRIEFQYREIPELFSLTPQKVLAVAMDQLVVLSANTGRVLFDHKVAWPRASQRVFLHRRDGACSVADQERCATQIIDCDDARPIGDPLRVGTIEFEGSGGSCFGHHLLLGRAADLVVTVGGSASIGERPPGEPRPVAKGIDVDTGVVRWTSDRVETSSPQTQASGMCPDGDTCWVAGNGGPFFVFSCATGALLYEKELQPQFALWLPAEAASTAGLFVRTKTTAALLDARTGAELWSVELPESVEGVPAGVTVGDQGIYLTNRFNDLYILDPTTGAPRQSVKLLGYKLLPTGAGGFYVAGTQQEWDAKGQPVPRDSDPPVFHVDREKGRAVVSFAASQEKIVELDTDAWSIGEVAAGSKRYLVLAVHREGHPIDLGVIEAVPSDR